MQREAEGGKKKCREAELKERRKETCIIRKVAKEYEGGQETKGKEDSRSGGRERGRKL